MGDIWICKLGLTRARTQAAISKTPITLVVPYFGTLVPRCPLKQAISIETPHLHIEDENMHKTKKVVMAALLMCIVSISVGSVIAMNGNQNGDLDRKQLKDGSCIVTVTDKQQDMLQDQLRERLKDGSCCDCICKL